MTAAAPRPFSKRGAPARPDRPNLRVLPGRDNNPAGREDNPRRRRRKKSRRRNPSSKNPEPVTWILLAGGSAVVVGGLIAYGMRRKRAAPSIGPGPTVVPGGGGGGGGGGGTVTHHNYVPYISPAPFSSEHEILVTLGELGYHVNYDGLLHWQSMVAVRNFEIDYNKFVANHPGLTPMPMGPIVVDHITEGMPAGTVGGLVGPQVLTALHNAVMWHATQPWPATV
jgi:hypothetical protein